MLVLYNLKGQSLCLNRLSLLLTKLYKVKKIIPILIVLPILLSLNPPCDDLSKFLYDIGKKESNNNYLESDNPGYYGKYQFSKLAIEDVGITVSCDEFLNNPCLQEEAMIKRLSKSHDRLRPLIKKYNGTFIDGVMVTESGILAGSHIGGVYGVSKFLQSSYDPADRFGTRISDYVKKFSGYKINLDNNCDEC